ncbi:MAG: type II toxin-antitoxin system death-on-curing family toxin [Candidatus Liptonbacteria bacterium]|nr:type II toxin-antitoxin system death-on-curing family toxin [Candidatus Liptonbacteria bacterium]
MKFGGKELYAGVFRKAGVYFEALATYHVFIDGNKRTELAVAARFLFLNGYTLVSTNNQAEKFILGVALKKHDVKAIAKWLKQNSERLD